ncbi:MAG: hypothetical protein RIF32_14960 [Leptospirales bacterium]|jgi:tRNA pseudouridine55 synthase
MLEGFVLADKPRGLGSAALVGRLKYELKKRASAAGAPRKIKVGHTGTLDRFASGLMLLLTGRTTALADQFLHADKAYVGRFQFGAFTDTHDSQGDVTQSVAIEETRRFLQSEQKRIRRAVLALRDVQRQQPPLYSALKQDGRRFSDLARSGQTELPAERDIRVYDVSLAVWDAESGAVDIDLHVSGGTYIRAFARDLSRELDFPIHLSELRRYRLGRHLLYAADEARQAVRRPAAPLVPGIWNPVFHESAGRESDRGPGEQAGALDGDAEDTGGATKASERDFAPVEPANIRDIRGALPDWPRFQVAPEDAAAVLQGRVVDPGNLPPEAGAAGMDFFLERSGNGAEPLGEAHPGTLLAWARMTRPGSYKYMRVFG